MRPNVPDAEWSSQEEAEGIMEAPTLPYRGIEAFRYVDRSLFFAREIETRTLLRHVTVYRGVFLYGDSGSGKSSLVNAGLVPHALRDGLRPDRFRVQPQSGAELVLERVAATTNETGPFLPSTFSDEVGGASRLVLSLDTFMRTLGGLAYGHDAPRPLLIFDQFEELVTLFETSSDSGSPGAGTSVQRDITTTLIELLRDQNVSAKLLFVFREDYLAKVLRLFVETPDLADHSVRLTSPRPDALERIIRGPFEEFPGRFHPELPAELGARLATAFSERTDADGINLSEVQIVCLRLWRSGDPEGLFEERGIQGLLEDHLSSALDSTGTVRDAQIAVLTRLVTAVGTRNVVSADDLVAGLRDDEGTETHTAHVALGALERARLIQRERRHDIDVFEIASEFLVPWISRQREDRLARSRRMATSRELAASSMAQLADDPELSLLLAVEAAQAFPSEEAANALRESMLESHVRVALRGHHGPVHGADFSPDGRLIVTAGSDGTARVWAIVEGRTEAVLEGHAGDVLSAVFSPDDRFVVSGGADGTIRAWDWRSGHGRVVGRHEGAVNALAFAPDGRRLSSASSDGLALVWEHEGGRWSIVARFRRHLGPVHCVAFSPSGDEVVSGGDDGLARVWDSRSGRQKLVLQGHAGPIWDTSFRSPGKGLDRRVRRQIATASFDGTAGLWEAVRPEGSHFKAPTPSFRDLIRTPFGSIRGRRLRTFTHPESVKAASFSPDGERLVTGSFDGKAQIWDVESAGRVLTFLGHRGRVTCARFSPDGELIATASADGTARVWRARSDRSLLELRGHAGGVNAAVFTPDDRSVVTGSADRSAKVWDAESGSPVGALNGHEGDVWNVAVSPDGRLASTASTDRTARIWDLGTRTALIVLRGHLDAVTSSPFGPDGKVIATSSFDGTVRLWDASTGELLRVITGHGGRVNNVAFSPDGRWIVSSSFDRTARVWDAASGEAVATLTEHPDWVGTSSFSPDGRLIVTSCWDRTARLWETETWRLVGELNGHTARVRTAIFSRDGSWIVTASADETARVWDASRRVTAAELKGHSGPLSNAAFSSDGSRVVTASHDRTARVFGWEVERSVPTLLTRAAARVTRSLTDEERKIFLHLDTP